MEDYGGSHNHVAEEDWSWIHNTPIDDNAANAAEEEQYSYYDDGINYEAEYSYTCESSLRVTGGGGTKSRYGHRRSVSESHTGLLLEADQGSRSSLSSEKDEHTKDSKTGKPKTHRFEHLEEPFLDSHSDPGYGDYSYETADYARNQNIDRVSNWLEDASLGEHPKDDSEPPRHAHAPPARRCPQRRHPPGADMVARSVSMPNHNDMDHYDKYETYPADVPYNDLTPPYDPASGYPYPPEVNYEDNHAPVYDPSVSSAPEGIYRLEPKPLEKALKSMKNRAVELASVSKTAAVGLASVSKTAAVGLASVSKTAAVGLKHRSIEFKNVAVPVMKPILNAVIEESMEHLMGPGRGSAPGHPHYRPNAAGWDYMWDYMPAPYYGPPLGRGRAGPMPRPMMRPPMRPGMPPDQRPVMRPSVPAGRMPLMRPGMPPGQRPVMGSCVPAGQRPLMRPGMQPPRGAAPLMAAAMRGQPRPLGRARPVAMHQ